MAPARIPGTIRRMRFLVPAALLVVLAPLGAAAAEATPRVIVDNPRIDLGRVARGQAAEGSFTVRNLGAAPLHILSAKPG